MNYYADVLKKYAVFSGRAQRKEFWMFYLYNGIVGIIAYPLIDGTKSAILSYIYLLYILVIITPALAVEFRRFHDTGRSGWWVLINLVPFVGWIIALILLAFDSQPSDNRYGPNPKSLSQSAVQV